MQAQRLRRYRPQHLPRQQQVRAGRGIGIGIAIDNLGDKWDDKYNGTIASMLCTDLLFPDTDLQWVAGMNLKVGLDHTYVGMGKGLDSVSIICKDEFPKIDPCVFKPYPGLAPGKDFTDFKSAKAPGTWKVCIGASRVDPRLSPYYHPGLQLLVVGRVLDVGVGRRAQGVEGPAADVRRLVCPRARSRLLAAYPATCNNRTLSCAWPPTSSGASRSSITLHRRSPDRRRGHDAVGRTNTSLPTFRCAASRRLRP